MLSAKHNMCCNKLFLQIVRVFVNKTRLNNTANVIITLSVTLRWCEYMTNMETPCNDGFNER